MKNPLPFNSPQPKSALFWLLVFALFPFCPIQAQSQSFDFFTTRDGLVANNVTSLFHEEGGYLWIGTSGGISRFDGQNFDNFSDFEFTPNGKILAIDQTLDKRLWFITNQALSAWHNGTFQEPKSFADGLRHLLTSKRKQRLWVAMNHGVAQLDDQAWTYFDASKNFPDQPITQLYEDSRGILWVGFRNGGVVRINPETKQWRRYGFDEGLPHLTVNHFLEASDGRFWVATHGGVVYLNDNAFMPAFFNDQLPSPIIYRLFEDQEKGLWMTASNAGAARWDGQDLEHYDRDSGMASNFSVDFLQDKWGHVWVLCRSGVSIYHHGTMAPIPASEGLQGRLMSVFMKDNDGLIWVGTSAGLNRFEEPRLKTFLEDPSDRVVQSSSTRTIFKDKQKRLWFPTFSGLAQQKGNNFQVFTTEDGLPSQLVLQWLEKKNGDIWVGTERGPAVFDGKTFQALQDSRVQDQVVINMVNDAKDRIWMLLSDWNLYRQTDPSNHQSLVHVGNFEGVLEIETQNDGSVWLSQIATLTKLDASGNATPIPVQTITKGKPTISRYFDASGSWWLGTIDDLIRFDGADVTHFSGNGFPANKGAAFIDKTRDGRIWFNLVDPLSEWPLRPIFTGMGVFDGDSFSIYTKKQGLHPLLSHFTFLDSKSKEWFFSNKGLSWIEGDSVKHIGVSDGLAGNRPYHLFWDHNDHLWIGTNGGLNKRSDNLMTSLSPGDGLLDPTVYDAAEDESGAIWIRTRTGIQRYRENPNPPAIDLVGVSDGENPLPMESGLELSHTQNDLFFHLRGIHLSKGANQMHFDYELKGKNKNWHGVTRDPKLHFPSLSPDDYTFTVRAYNRDLQGSHQAQTFSFRILPPWWFRTWFLITAICLSTLLGYLLYRIRLKVRLEKARVFSELQTAHDMQLSLMPKTPPITSVLKIFGKCEPAKEVGGDYFDYFWLDDGHEELGIAIMDVAGKSMEAAIISVMASGLVCSEIGQRNAPSTILSRINFPLYQKTGKKIFTTGLVGALHTKTLAFRWSNAGHLDPVLLRNRKVRHLETVGKRDLPLGAVKNWNYQQSEFQLQPGDLLFMYTDGLTEASDKDGAFYGTHRMDAFLEANAHVEPKALVKLLLEDVKKFAGQMPQYDDITLVAIRVNTPQSDVSLT